MGPEKSNTQHSINRDRFATAKEVWTVAPNFLSIDTTSPCRDG